MRASKNLAIFLVIVFAILGAVAAVLLRAPRPPAVPSPEPPPPEVVAGEGETCGTIAGIECPAGLVCYFPNDEVLDAAGVCGISGEGMTRFPIYGTLAVYESLPEFWTIGPHVLVGRPVEDFRQNVGKLVRASGFETARGTAPFLTGGTLFVAQELQDYTAKWLTREERDLGVTLRHPADFAVGVNVSPATQEPYRGLLNLVVGHAGLFTRENQPVTVMWNLWRGPRGVRSIADWLDHVMPKVDASGRTTTIAGFPAVERSFTIESALMPGTHKTHQRMVSFSVGNDIVIIDEQVQYPNEVADLVPGYAAILEAITASLQITAP